MPTAYLQSSEYVAYGLTAATTAAQVTQASALIDAYLYRPEGLLWGADGNGMPCYMIGMPALYTLQASAALVPGLNVQVPMTGPVAALQVGDVLILDSTTPAVCEACIVAAIAGGSVTLKEVLFSHAANVLIEFGRVIEEQKTMPTARPITFVARGPLLRIISGTGRYGYGRRGDARNMNMNDFNLLAAVSNFGGPPAWQLFSPLNTGFDANGQVWIPAGVLLAYYSEVKIRYIAGFQYANLPSVIKSACAALVQAIVNQPALGSVKSFKAGDTAVVNFTNGIFNDDMHMQLNPYRAKLFA